MIAHTKALPVQYCCIQSHVKESQFDAPMQTFALIGFDATSASSELSLNRWLREFALKTMDVRATLRTFRDAMTEDGSKRRVGYDRMDSVLST